MSRGRGFAVVAQEVRALAGRSATAAKEIKGLISDSVRQVDSGAKLVQRAGETMGDIVSSIGRGHDPRRRDRILEPGAGFGINGVSRAISQMDQVTQQNAALVEEAAACRRAHVCRGRGRSARASWYSSWPIPPWPSSTAGRPSQRKAGRGTQHAPQMPSRGRFGTKTNYQWSPAISEIAVISSRISKFNRVQGVAEASVSHAANSRESHQMG